MPLTQRLNSNLGLVSLLNLLHLSLLPLLLQAMLLTSQAQLLTHKRLSRRLLCLLPAHSCPRFQRFDIQALLHVMPSTSDATDGTRSSSGSPIHLKG